MSHGASLDRINEVWYTPLHIAAQHGNLALLNSMLDAADAAGTTYAAVIDMPRKVGRCGLTLP